MRRVILQLRFEREDGVARPVAASTKQRGAGARVTLEVEPEALAAGTVWVLYRAGAAEMALAGSARRERVEAVLRTLGPSYRIAQIPVEDAAT